MKRRLLAGLIPAALALSGPVQADIYAFVDSNGVRHLSNIPNDPRYKLVMRTPAYSQQAARPSSYAPSNLYNANRSATLFARIPYVDDCVCKFRRECDCCSAGKHKNNWCAHVVKLL